MKYWVPILILVILPVKVFSHSGGTDENGCHAGSQPYHCHAGDRGTSSSSSQISIGAWDLNAGYQFDIHGRKWIPFFGVSVGKDKINADASPGANLGVKHHSGWYGSYVSTSKSIQLGYELLHLSANSRYLGIGVRYPFKGPERKSRNSIYFSGSVLFSSDE